MRANRTVLGTRQARNTRNREEELIVKANTGTYGRVPLEIVIRWIRLHTRI